MVDSYSQGSIWDGVLGDFIKFALAVVSIFYDSIFLLQEYYWFKGCESTSDTQTTRSGEQTPLLHGEDGENYQRSNDAETGMGVPKNAPDADTSIVKVGDHTENTADHNEQFSWHRSLMAFRRGRGPLGMES